MSYLWGGGSHCAHPISTRKTCSFYPKPSSLKYVTHMSIMFIDYPIVKTKRSIAHLDLKRQVYNLTSERILKERKILQI